ncbi:hypothetical protein C10C_0115 [Chlamydia serpentis]|uniref:Uncharacterized protein n=1 Tax=Chlamydia serpentis TaxID=1967782 RepID=A0A2R8FA45_9CHLA|nr:hypothetical protein [Chlamydia serpentis]SPN73300.1 hypothetical protein C10C_0115 [Chlamydia serpentis]
MINLNIYCNSSPRGLLIQDHRSHIQIESKTRYLYTIVSFAFLVAHFILGLAALVCAGFVLSSGLYLGLIIPSLVFGILGLAFFAAYMSYEPTEPSSLPYSDKNLPSDLCIALKSELLHRFGKDNPVSSNFFNILFEEHNPTISDLYQLAFLCGGFPEDSIPRHSEALNIYKALSIEDRRALANLVTEGLNLEEILAKHCPVYWFSNLGDIVYKKHHLSLSEFLGLGHPTFPGFVHKDYLPVLALLDFNAYSTLFSLSQKYRNFDSWKSVAEVQSILQACIPSTTEGKEDFASWLYESFAIVVLCKETKELLSYLGTVHASSLSKLSKQNTIEMLVECISNGEMGNYECGLSKTWNNYYSS